MDKLKVKVLMRDKAIEFGRKTGLKPHEALKYIREEVTSLIPDYDDDWMSNAIEYNQLRKELENELKVI